MQAISGTVKHNGMIKKVFVLLLSSVAFFSTYAQPKKKVKAYRIQATLSDWDSSFVSIVSNGRTLYSTPVQKGGFQFTGQTGEPVEAYFVLQTKNVTCTVPFFIEPGTIHIQDSCIKENNSITIRFDIKGTAYNDLRFNLYKRLDSLFSHRSFDEEIYQANRQYVKDYIRTNSSSLLTLGLFRIFILQSAISEQEKLSIFNSIANKVRNTYGGEEISREINQLINTTIGKTAPLFSLPDTSNKNVTLKQFQGQYVLLDFWASWCGPCREENPAIKKVYEEFKDSLVILSVSLDDDKEKWLKAIKQDGLTWVHISDLKGWNNAVAKQYYIESIPANFLLDPAGIIIGKNLRGQALSDKLSAILKNKTNKTN